MMHGPIHIKKYRWKILGYVVFTEMNISIPVNMCPKTTTSWDNGVFRIVSAAGGVCGFHARKHNFQLFFP